MEMLAKAYTSLIGGIFLLIGAIMLVAPGANLAGDGVDFASFPTAGKAEVRAYYVGTALCVAWTVLRSELRAALLAIAVVLGGFAGTRVVGYALDGVDGDEALAFHQNAVFVSEVVGCTVALMLLPAAARDTAKKSS